jgi:hypothetical protein
MGVQGVRVWISQERAHAVHHHVFRIVGRVADSLDSRHPWTDRWHSSD